MTPEEGDAMDLAEHTMSEGWTACGPCAEFIELRDMERLITRLRRTKPEMFTKISRTQLRQHFGEFLHRISTREPIDHPTSSNVIE